jgi:mycobactin peptide synthetase MbtE
VTVQQTAHQTGQQREPADAELSADTVHELVRGHAAATPDAVALVHGEEQLTYGQLDRLSDAAARGLARAGLRQGDFLPVQLPRSTALVAVVLGALKLGAAYALLDLAWPDERVRDEIGQLGAELLVTATAAPACCPVRAVSPEDLLGTPPAAATAEGGPATPRAEVASGDACCVFFTSGTTGRPKGAVSPHRGILRLVGPGSFVHFGPDTVMPLAAAQPWDLFSLELWAPLLTGGRVVIIDEPYLSAALVPELVARHGVNTAFFTTSLFNMLVDEDLGCFRGLRTVISGGERLSPPQVKAFLAAYPETAMVNGYGPVEATVFASTRLITPADCELPGGIPIGVPVTRTRVHVLDGERPCADGEPGELCIAGDGLAVEYLGNPELTALKFPTLRLDGRDERVYRTGDLGFRDGDGVLHYQGRADRQVKVRGHRVEALEVEAVIGGLAGVARCVVLPRQAADGSCVGLLGFYLPDAAAPDPEALLKEVRTRLAAYQVPDRLIPVDSIPLMPNGKLDGAVLLALAGPSDQPEALEALEPMQPLEPLQALVRGVFAAVVALPPERIAPDTTLTALGATSLDLGRVAARLGDVLGRPVPVSRIFRAPTVRGLAAWLREAEETAAALPAAVLPAAAPGRDAPAPLSSMQTYMLLNHQVDPDSTGMHCVFSWRIEGRPDRAALRAAVAYVHQRHRILGAVFRYGEPALALPGDSPAPAMTELLVQTEAEARAALDRELARPFRCEEGRNWHPVFIAVREVPVTLFGVAFHHIVFDGGSAAPLGADLAHAYNAFRAGREPDQPPAPGPAQVAADRDVHLRYADLPAQREYWRAATVAMPELSYPEPAEPTGAASAKVETALPAELVAGVRKFAADNAVSPFVVYVAAYAQTLAELTGQSEFGIGTSLARRGHSTLLRAVDCLIDIVCLRLTAEPGRSGAEAVAATSGAVAAAFAAQDVPIFEVFRLNEAKNGHGEAPERPPLFQNMFVLQDNPLAELPLDGLATEYFRPTYPGLPSEFVTDVWPRADGSARLVIGYQPDRVPARFCRALADRYPALLAGFLTGTDAPEPA